MGIGEYLRSRARATACGALLLGLAVCAPAAGAHAILVESSPTEGESCRAAPKEAVLRFNARIERKVARVTLLDGDGQRVALPPIPAGGKDAASDRLTVPLPALKPGSYRLEYRVLAADGHATPGLLRFSVAPPPHPATNPTTRPAAEKAAP
jgi:methionine-rich copper-binding protein CopC